MNLTEEAQRSPLGRRMRGKVGSLTPKPRRAFKSQAGQQSRSPKAKVSGLFPEWQVRSLGLGKLPGDGFHMESPHAVLRGGLCGSHHSHLQVRKLRLREAESQVRRKGQRQDKNQVLIPR